MSSYYRTSLVRGMKFSLGIYDLEAEICIEQLSRHQKMVLQVIEMSSITITHRSIDLKTFKLEKS